MEALKKLAFNVFEDNGKAYFVVRNKNLDKFEEALHKSGLNADGPLNDELTNNKIYVVNKLDKVNDNDIIGDEYKVYIRIPEEGFGLDIFQAESEEKFMERLIGEYSLGEESEHIINEGFELEVEPFRFLAEIMHLLNYDQDQFVLLITKNDVPVFNINDYDFAIEEADTVQEEFNKMQDDFSEGLDDQFKEDADAIIKELDRVVPIDSHRELDYYTLNIVFGTDSDESDDDAIDLMLYFDRYSYELSYRNDNRTNDIDVMRIEDVLEQLGFEIH